MDLTETRRKAEEGSVVCQGALGWHYLYGVDTPVDYGEALRWLSTAAYEGRASRPFTFLGHMYLEGLGVSKDVNEAIRHYKAVQKVEPRAQLALARIYAQGNGVPPDPAEAFRLYSAVLDSCDDCFDPKSVAVVAFAGALTCEELDEAKAYVAQHR